jgi:hypothetical protein
MKRPKPLSFAQNCLLEQLVSEPVKGIHCVDYHPPAKVLVARGLAEFRVSPKSHSSRLYVTEAGLNIYDSTPHHVNTPTSPE